MKIINYSIIFSSIFIITACGSTGKIKTPSTPTINPHIALCAGGHSTETFAGIEAEYRKRNGNIFIKKGKSDGKQINFNGFKGDVAVRIYNTYVKCVQSQYNKNNRGYVSTYRDQSPNITNNNTGSNNPSTVNIDYAN